VKVMSADTLAAPRYIDHDGLKVRAEIATGSVS